MIMMIVTFFFLSSIVSCSLNRVQIIPVYGDVSYHELNYTMVDYNGILTIPEPSLLPSFECEMRLSGSCWFDKNSGSIAVFPENHDRIVRDVVSTFSTPMTALRDKIFKETFLSEKPSLENMLALFEESHQLVEKMKTKLSSIKPNLCLEDMYFVPRFLLPEVHLNIQHFTQISDYEQVESTYWMYMQGPRFTKAGFLSYFRFGEDMRKFIAH